MLRNLKDLFDQLTTSLTAPAAAQTPAAAEHTLQLATAVLLVEVMRAEPRLQDSERDAVLAALRRKFQLADDELERLLELAHDTARNAYDYQRFTALMNERFSQPQKIAVVEAMWEVAFADQHLDAHEHHVISKVAGLLHVTHGEYISAKLHAQAALQAR
ncbi:TerB family tellurite resistance protein [Hydrogenophaga palleronii]|uniref:tellurite resistance TerB family protein n=1 Tax=Hydrogenophaga palleronii TaxID=65655 RepID=UPI0008263E94|nr:TerB family tellurite resistance protein [Hydrogenophaga palleronii]